MMALLITLRGHLYRHHRIFPCQRCNVLFKDADGVSMHLKEPKGCEPNNFEQADGITSELYEKLRSKKKLQRDQTEVDRWKEIYKLLFPNEIIPSPYFEAVQEELIFPPNPRELAEYEEYCRRQLPPEFKAALEEIINNELQPMKESIRSQLTKVVKDCQDRVFSKYRGIVEGRAGTSSRSLESPTTSVLISSTIRHVIEGPPESSLRSYSPPILHQPYSGLSTQMSKPTESIQLSETGDNSDTSAVTSSSSQVIASTKKHPPLSDPQCHAENISPLDLAHSVPRIEDEDYDGILAAEFLDGSWIDFEAGLVERDDFVP
ncbi:hypothetical protein BKA64DRAFT_61306 [Cadophora sp. MPI-SDFR-AT-0126]|nr:hypothetical protein BKA64DRAFT_61306 [Leotiomycetes sp. MPI-SDFR-AT-0126]